MLYLHCGWLKTGTTSLQAALDWHRGDLESAGLRNLKAWRVLPKRLNGPASDSTIAEFVDDVEAQAERDLLLSCETFMSMMLTDRRQDAFLRLLDAVQAAMPVTCIWTLRRWDEMMCSYYSWQLSYGLDPPSFRDYLASLPQVTGLLTGMCRVADFAASNPIYCKYDSTGSHNHRILSSLGLPAPVISKIGEFGGASRLNAALSYKQTVALLNVRHLAEKSGVELDKGSVREAFTSGGVRFDGDRPCELMDLPHKRRVHEEALACAHEVGFEPYLDFFQQEEIEGPMEADLLGDVGSISEDDLIRLAGYASTRNKR